MANFVLPRDRHHKSDRMGQPLRLVLIGRADPHMMTQTVLLLLCFQISS